MIDTQAIRSKILDLAIRGKLTGQLPEDGTAEHLVATSTNKKITRMGEIPFEIPSNWRWSSIEKLTTPVGRKNNQIFANEVKQSGKYPAISQGEQFIDGYTDEEKAIVDIPVVIFGDHTKNVKFVDFPFVICADGTKCLKVSSPNNPKYVFYWMKYASCAIEDRGYARHYSLIKKFPVSLPPLAEQQRVVDKIEQVFSVLDTIDALQAQYTDNLTILKSKLIDAAIQGKLTEQLPEDGTAEDLYQQIQSAKQSLSNAGKLKREKPLPEISADEIPFEIPDNWKWVRLADITTTNIGLTYHPEDIAEEGTVVVRSSNIVNSRMDYADLVKVRCPIRDNQYLNHHDIVICARNGSKALVGKCAIYEGKSGMVAFGAFMAVLRTPFYRYVFYYLHTDAFRRYFHSDDSKQINQVTQNILKEALIPLPPLAEQKRIVAKLEVILQLCNKLK